ncbi:MAG TPA: hypothetical protein VL986_11515 [Terracidiphilus sp.]|nr:hypothetical protein [Terracidiphilus sp.]
MSKAGYRNHFLVWLAPAMVLCAIAAAVNAQTGITKKGITAADQLLTPTIVVSPSLTDATLGQGVMVSVNVSGAGGSPVPTGTVMLMASQPDSGSVPVIYDTFQYPNGTSLTDQVAQSGNAQWTWTGGGSPTVEEMHLNPIPNIVNNYYASLPNTTAVGAPPSPVTAVGATFELCQLPGSTSYDASHVSMAMLAQHDTGVNDFIHLNFAPTVWALSKRVEGGEFTEIVTGALNLTVDCQTTYSIQMLVDQSAGTVQVIPPSGVPSAVVTDPDFTTVDPEYGTWEAGSGTTCDNCAYASVESVWMGGGYVSPAAVLNAGSASLVIPAGSLPVGADTLTVTYIPDTQSAAIYTGATGTSSIAISEVTPAISVTPSPSTITTAQPVTMSIGVSGGAGEPVPTGSVVLSGAGFSSASTALKKGSASVMIPAGALSIGADTLTATYTPDAESAPFYDSTSQTAVVTVIPLGFTLAPAPATLSIVQGGSASSTISVTDTGGFDGNISLTASGLPSGVTASFAAGSSAGTELATFTAGASAPVTTSPATVTIMGSSGTLSGSTQIVLSVMPAPGFTLAPAPATLSIVQGGSGSSTISVTDTGGFDGNISLTASGLPSGVTASFAAGSSAGTQVAAFTAGASAPVTTSPATVTIMGSSGTLSGSTQIALSVTPPPGFTGTGSGTSSISIDPGATTGNTTTLSVVGTNGFTGIVNLSCTVTTSMVNPVDPPQCSLNPTTLTVSGSAAQVSTLMATTTAPVTASNGVWRRTGNLAGGAVLAFLVMLVLPTRRRAWPLLIGLVAAGGLIGSIGCSGGGGNRGGGSPGTTPGTYTVTVTGTSGSLSATVATITLIVE